MSCRREGSSERKRGGGNPDIDVGRVEANGRRKGATPADLISIIFYEVTGSVPGEIHPLHAFFPRPEGGIGGLRGGRVEKRRGQQIVFLKSIKRMCRPCYRESRSKKWRKGEVGNRRKASKRIVQLLVICVV